DQPTSGVLPLALGREGSAAANWLAAQFGGRLVQKEYLCLCEGPTFGPEGSFAELSSSLKNIQLSRDTFRVEAVTAGGRPAQT
ncbi:unnamed protein product, partial [Symbiodinium pilosum]